MNMCNFTNYIRRARSSLRYVCDINKIYMLQNDNERKKCLFLKMIVHTKSKE